MKTKLIIVFIVCMFHQTLIAQTENDTIPHFLIHSTLPNFTMLVTKAQISKSAKDSTWYTQDSLPKDKNVVLIYFSPECGHCQIEAQQIRKYSDSLLNTQFVWMSYSYSNKDLWQFYNKYELNKCPNVVLGKILTYHIPTFFKVLFTPYMALYNRQHLFLSEFRRGTTIETLQKWLQ